jgi:hypothetical protein
MTDTIHQSGLAPEVTEAQGCADSVFMQVSERMHRV